MSAESPPPPLLPEPPAPPPAVVLRKLFLTLFLRGRGARGLRKQTAPKSVAQKLWIVLAAYAAFGCFALIFLRQTVFALSVYLHAMTFSFLGMYVASSAGEVLFNREENDILLHRPVSPRTMLWAKIRVLAEVSLWVGGAFNLAGLLVGIFVSDGSWRFPFAHALSTMLETLFCTGSVVLAYQICLTCFGRERLEALITTSQVVVSVGAVLAGQVVPRVMFQAGTVLHLQPNHWWTFVLPPAWFAGLDDALAGSGSGSSWWLAGEALVCSAAVLGIAFGLLARSYQMGMQALNETVVARPRSPHRRRRWLDALAHLPPLSWCLRDSVARASFILTGAYLFRDRDVKLRVYPGIAPILALPVVMILQARGIGRGSHGSALEGFMLAFGAGYLGVIPLLALGLLQYSQQWQAFDIFRAAPLAGPAQICRGARWAVMLVLTAPLLLVFVALLAVIVGPHRTLLLFLPGVIALPVFALVAQLGGGGIPLSRATEEAKAAGRGMIVIVVMIAAAIGSSISAWAFATGWFGWFLLGETVLVLALIFELSRRVAATPWPSLE